MAKPISQFLTSLSFLSLLFHLSTSLSTIHDVLRSNGLPAGLLPKAVKSFTLHDSGALEVFLDRPCLTKFENRVFFDAIVRANLSYAALTDVVGLQQLELFLWLPVKDIIVNDPNSGLILFDMGVAHKQLSLSLFDDPPDCKPEGELGLNLKSGLLWKNGRKEKGFLMKAEIRDVV